MAGTRAALASDRHADDDRRHDREDVVVAKAVIAAVEVTSVSQVDFSAEDTLDGPPDASTPCQMAAIVESGAQRLSGIPEKLEPMKTLACP